MTDAQILQLMGISLAAMGLTWTVNPKAFKQLVKDMANNRGVLLLMGMLALIMGYLIVVVHPTSSVLVLLLGWAALLKGLFIIFLSSSNLRFFSLLANVKKYFAAMPWLVLIVGIIAMYFGYLA